ncbi:MAG TPA: prohibitin family protein [Candidatus Absconditabacterales bacterium]|nr:prohibitin family protein [Candidatus Absconditabacterales bacterium]
MEILEKIIAKFSRRKVSITLLIVIFFISFINQFYFIVQPGEKAFLVRLGAVSQTIYDNGFYLKLPFIERVVTMSIQTQKYQVEADAASKDLQNIKTDVALNFRINPASVGALFQQVGTIEDIAFKIIGPAIQETVKATTAKFTAEELITKRETVSSEMKTFMKTKLENFGIVVEDINIVNFNFSEDFDKAIESKVRAEQDALTEKNKLEQIKYEAQQAIEKARGASEATLLRAKAEAEAIRIQSQAIQQNGGANYVNLKWIEKRNGQLPSTQLGGNTPVIFNPSR